MMNLVIGMMDDANERFQKLRLVLNNSPINYRTPKYIACIVLLVLSFSVLAAENSTVPTGGDIVSGTGNITQSGLTTTINQGSNAIVIDWDTFNVGSDSIVNFLQPGSTSIALNRIFDQNPSEIHGQINANGHVVLLNPYGVLFGATASVSVGGLVASSLSITPEDFMNGDYVFRDLDGINGSVVNYGLINASTGGSVALLGETVANHGHIIANLGSVSLAAGREAILTFDNQGLLGVSVTEAVLQDEIGVDPAVLNSGEINAAGGRILLTASVSEDVFSQAVNMGELRDATDVEVHEDGSFTLSSNTDIIAAGETPSGHVNRSAGQAVQLGAGADVVNTGELNVSAADSSAGGGGEIVLMGENVTSSGSLLADASFGHGGRIELHANDTALLTGDSVTSARATTLGRGGDIHVLGDRVGLFGNSIVDVSGANGAGVALIGGDYRGENDAIRNASGTYVGQDTQILADGLVNGDGGTIIVWGDYSARVYGSLSAQGGVAGGDGGFIETSARVVDLNLDVNVSALNGASGTWLIDPYNITISNGTSDTTTCGSGTDCFTNDGSDSILNVDDLIATLSNGANVIVETTTGGSAEPTGGNITLASELDLHTRPLPLGPATLTLRAHHNIIIDAAIVDSGRNDVDVTNIVLEANSNGADGGDVNINADISTRGGSFTASGENINFTNGADIETENRDDNSDEESVGGAVNLTATLAITGALGSDIVTRGGDVTILAGTDFSMLGSIDSSGADSSGADNTAGGDIEITSTNGNISVGELNADGGTTDRDGGTGRPGSFAGDITLTANSQSSNLVGIVTVGGVVSAVGSNSDYRSSDGANSGQRGGDGGDVIISAGNEVNINNSITTDGGHGDGDNNDAGAGGDAGNIQISVLTDIVNNDSITVSGDFSARGGAGVGVSTTGVDAVGGNGGVITFTANDIELNNDISVEPLDWTDADADGVSWCSNSTRCYEGTAGTVNANISGVNGVVDINRTTAFTSLINIGQVIGVGGTQTIEGANANITWVVDGSGSGHLELTSGGTDLNVQFSDIENLTGGTGNDVFNLAENGVMAGTIDGGSGDNILQRSNTTGTNDWLLTGQHQGTLNGDNFSNIQTLTGSASVIDTLTGRNQSNQWLINGLNQGTVSENTGSPTDTVSFTEMENLTGGTANDLFALAQGGSVSGSIDGGTGTNTLQRTNTTGANIWILTGQHSGTVNGGSFSNIQTLTGSTSVTDTLTGRNQSNLWTVNTGDSGTVAENTGGPTDSVSFSDMENLTGGTGNDLFELAEGGSVSGDIDGGSGTNTLQRTNTTGTNTWILTGQHSGTINGGSFSNIQTLTGSASVVDTLTGRNQNNTWNINGTNEGSVEEAVGSPTDTVSFTRMESLNGNAGDDRFQFTDGGSISGSIDAGAHITGDVVDYSLQSTVSVNIGSAFNGVTNAEIIQGNNTDSTLIGADVSNSWLIDGENDGSISGITFIDFNNLTGGSDTDVFNLAEGGSVTGTINGAGGINTLQRSNTTGINAWILTGQHQGTLNGDNFSNIQTLIGSASVVDTLTARNQSNFWTVNGTNSGTLVEDKVAPTDLVTFSEMENLNGGSGADRFEFSGGGTIAGALNAGAGVDSITVEDNSSVAGLIDGGSDTDSIIYTSGSDLLITLGTDVDQVESVTASGGGTNTLVGEDVVGGNTWSITDSGNSVNDTVTDIAFSGFSILNASANGDLFNVSNGGVISIINGGIGNDDITLETAGLVTTINGGNGTDSLAITNGDKDWIIDLTDNGSVTEQISLNVSNFTSIETRIGSAAGFDGINLSSFGTTTIFLATYLNFDEIIGSTTGTLQGIDGQTNDWTINGTNAGTVVVGGTSTDFSGFLNLTGGNGTDNFDITETGFFTGLLDGGAGNNTLSRSNISTANTWVLTGQHQGTLNGRSFQNIQTLAGSASVVDTLTGVNQNNTWTITGGNEGTVEQAIGSPTDTVTFSEMENLNGSAGDDRFRFTDAGTISGLIDAGAHVTGDVIDYSLQTTVSLSVATALSAVQNAETIQGNNTDSTLIGIDGINTWTITGENDGSVSGLTFVDFNNLTGGSLSDTFNLAEGGSVTGMINGGSGTNILQRTNTTGSNSWILTGQYQGTLNGGAFSNIQVLTGSASVVDSLVGRSQDNLWTVNGTNSGSVAEDNGLPSDSINFTEMDNLIGGTEGDVFNLTTTGSVSGSIDGGAGSNTLQSSTTLGTNTWTLTGQHQGTLNSIGFSNIQTLAGSDSVTDILIGRNQNNLWTITGTNSGTLAENTGSPTDTIAFSSMGALNGGTGDDVFNITENGLISGAIDGGTGTNALQRSNTSGINTWILTGQHQGTSNGLGFSNIQTLTGSASVVDTLFSRNQNNLWTVTGTNQGTLSENSGVPSDLVSFSEMENLTGGTANDYFDLAEGASVSGIIEGGTGDNTLQRSNTTGTNTWILTGEYQGTLNGGSFLNFQTLVGSASVEDILTGRNQDNLWALTGANQGSLAEDSGAPTDTVTFSEMDSLTGGTGDDVFDLAEGASLSGSVDGGAGNNTLRRSNTTGTNAWILTGQYQGTLNGSGFSNIQTLTGSSNAVDTLTARNQDNYWSIDGAGLGSLAEDIVGATDRLSFYAMDNLTGGTGNDVFYINSGGSILGAVDGGAGSNTLESGSLSGTNTWQLTGQHLGTLNGVGFSNIQSLVGSDSVEDILIGRDQNNLWTVTSTNSGTLVENTGSPTDLITFSSMGILNGGNGNDVFTITEGGLVSGSIDGGAGTNTLQRTNTTGTNTWILTGEHQGSLNGGSFSNIQTLTGSTSVEDTLIARNQTNSWTVTGINSGTVAEDVGSPTDSVTFGEMENLTGGSDSDVFNLAEGGSITGMIDGAAGANVLQRTNTTGVNSWVLTGQYQGTLNGGGFSNIQTLTGSANATDTLTGRNQDNTWTINGADAGTVAEVSGSPTDTITFTEMENLNGSNGDDRFRFTDSGSISGTIDAGAHATGDIVDYSLQTTVSVNLGSAFNGVINAEIIQGNDSDSTLTGDNVSNSWLINGENDGVIDGITFINFNNLIGGNDADVFNFAEGGSVTGSVDGGAGSNTLQRSNTTGTNTWILTGLHQGTSNGIGFSNIQTLTGSASVVDMLTGRNQNNQWTVNGSNQGTVAENIGSPTDTVTFSEIEYLIGGTGDDVFELAEGGFVVGSIDGGAGDNTLQRTNTTGTNDWVLTGEYQGSLNGRGFANIQTLIGSASTEDTLTGRNQNNNWTIDGADAGSVAEDIVTPTDTLVFSEMENLNGSAGDDRFRFTDTGSISGIIDAGAHVVGDIIDYSLQTTVVLSVANALNAVLNAEIIQGNNTASTLIGGDVDSTWTITGENDGTVSGLTFVDFNNLTGGSEADLFNLTEGGSVTGTIEGGAGINTLQRTNTSGANTWILTGQYQGTLNGGSFSNIQTLTGSSSVIDTLTGVNQDNTWNITGTNSGTVEASVATPTDSVAFSSMENLNGSAGDDRFRFDVGGTVSGTIDAGAHTNGDIVDYSLLATVDITVSNAFNGVLNAEVVQGNNTASTLTGSNIANTWIINGENDGTVEGIAFIDFNNLIGGSENDAFDLTEGGSITGIINGGAGSNTLERSNTTGTNLWILTGQHEGTLNGGSFSNFQTLIGSLSVVDSLTGRNQNNLWNVTGGGAGTLEENNGAPTDTLTFSEMDNLTGGSADDLFNLAEGGSVAGTIEGGAGSNTLQRSNTTGTNAWVLTGEYEGTLNGGSFSSIQTLTGSANAVDTLTGRDQTNLWSVDGADSGSVSEDIGTPTDTLIFSEMENLTGGAGVDLFNLTEGGSVSGVIDGGASVNVLQRSNTTGTNSWVLTGQNQGTLNGGSFSNFQVLVGSSSVVDTLTARDQNNLWTIDNANSGTLSEDIGSPTDSMSFFEIDNLVGNNGNDVFNLSEGGSITGTINGGAGSNTLQRSNTSGTNTWIVTGQYQGSLNGSGFSNIQTLTGSANAVDTLTGRDQNNLWTVNGIGLGVLAENSGAPTDTLAFSEMENLMGGSADDVFELAEGGSLVGTLDGGAGNNTLMRTNITGNNEWVLTDQFQGTVNGGAFANIQTLTGSASTVDTLTGRNQNNLWTILGTDSGTVSEDITSQTDSVSFSEFENLVGLAGDDRFRFADGALITGSIDAGDHINGDTVDYSLQLVVSVNLGAAFNGVSNAEVIQGNNTNSTLIANNSANDWLITGENDGSISGITFIDFNNLTGGTADDIFNLAEGASITGTIDGGAGTNTLQRSNTSGTNLWVITGLQQGTLNGGNFSNIQNLVGSGDTVDTLVGRNQDNDWVLNGADTGTLSVAGDTVDIVNFSNIENLTGNDGDDRFIFETGSSISGAIDGGDHVNGDIIDYSRQSSVSLTVSNALAGAINAEVVRGNNIDSTLIGDDVSNTWMVTGENDGTIGGINFVDFNNLTGGSDADLFVIANTGSVTGIISGGVGTGSIDTLDITALTRDVSVAADDLIAADFNISDIEDVQANTDSNYSNTLIGGNNVNVWNIDGDNAGSLSFNTTNLIFSGFSNLTGGSLNDTFNLNNLDHVSGLINGGGGSADELNLLSLGRDITVQLGSIAGANSSDILYADNIEIITASSARNNTLIGSEFASTWSIDGTGTSRIERQLLPNAETTVAFSGFNVLSGGDGDDSFEIVNATNITQINGGDGAGNDSIDYSNILADVSITVGSSLAPDGVAVNGIEGLIGNNNGLGSSFNSTITVIDGDNIWTIADFDGAGRADGINDGQFQDSQGNVINFIDFNILQGGSGIDIFDVQIGASITGFINGGAGNDELRLAIGGSGQLRFIGGADTDSVLLTGGGSGFDVIFASDVNGDDQLTYTSGSDSYLVSYVEAENVQDNVLADSLTINGSTAADLIEISTGFVSVNGGTALQYGDRSQLILAGDANDTFDLVGNLNLAGGSLSINNSSLTNSSDSIIVADSLTLNAANNIGSSDARVNTAINTLTVNNVVGDVYLDEVNTIELQTFNTTGIFDLIAGNNVTQGAGNILVSSNDFVISSRGDIDLSNQNELAGSVGLSALNSIVFNNTLDTDLLGIITQDLTMNITGSITDSGAILVSGLLDVQANGNDVILDNAGNNFNLVNLTGINNATLADSGNLRLNNINIDGLLQIDGENISTNAAIVAGSMDLNATGVVRIENELTSVSGDINVNAGQIIQNANVGSSSSINFSAQQGIVMDADTISTALADISYTANNDVSVSSLSAAGGTVFITSANGQIVDNNDNNDSDNIVAQRAELRAANGIGVGNALETQLVTLFAENTQGEINIDNVGTITIDRLATVGDITFNNSGLGDGDKGDIKINPGSIDAGFDVGTLFLSTIGGSFLGEGDTPSFDNADIVARSATFFDSALQGTLGTIKRPIVARIRDSVVITVGSNLDPLFAPPTPIIDDSNSLFRFSSFDTVSALAGGQLVEVESLVEVDPAIFTDLRNYSHDEIAVRLPRDQLFEDEEDGTSAGR